MEVTVYSRSDGSLFRVLPSTAAPEREARRMSYGQPFQVQVVARVPGVNEAALLDTMRKDEVGSGWYSTSLPDLLEALAGATREAQAAPKKRDAAPIAAVPKKHGAVPIAAVPKKRGAKPLAEAPSKRRAEGEREELGAWQNWLEPCSSALAPRATEVKAALRERGAPSWLLPLCREVSQRDATGHYRKILKLATQTVQPASVRDPAAQAAL
jgi:hypothetical protein